MLVLMSFQAEAQDAGWRFATVLPGSVIKATLRPVFSDCYTVETYNQKDWYRCEDTEKIHKLNWQSVWDEVHRDATFTIDRSGYLYIRFDSQIPESVFCYEKPTLSLSKKGKDNKWHDVWIGGNIYTPVQKQQYRIGSDGALKYYGIPPIYEAGQYKFTVISATRNNTNRSERVYVQSSANAKVYFVADGTKVDMNSSATIPAGHQVGYVQAIISNGGYLVDETTHIKLNNNDPLYAHQVVSVKGDAMAKVVLTGYKDKPIFIIKSNTRIKLLEPQEKDVSISQQVFLFFGKLFFRGDGVDHKGVRLETVNSILGCEGTQFEMVYDPSAEMTEVSVLEGLVTLRCKNGDLAPAYLSSGQKGVLYGSCNRAVRPLTGDELAQLEAEYKITAPAVPSEKQLLPVADAHVYAFNYRNWNRSNRGKYDQIVAGWHPTGGESRAYIKFDLSKIDPSSVNKATLRLYHFQTTGGNGVNLGIYRVTGYWKEGRDTYHSGRNENTAAPGEISWVQQPPADGTLMTSFNPGRRSGDWVDVDITPLVKEWLAGVPNHGLVIKPLSHKGESVYHFASRERDAKLDQPKGNNKAPLLLLSAESTAGNQTISETGKTNSSLNLAQLPFYDNFSMGASKWTLPANAAVRQGQMFWNTGADFKALRLNASIPMENIVVEFDGYAETNGLTLHIVNADNSGYISIFGGWMNSQSGSDVGKPAENRELVAGKVWQPRQWSHYKVVRSGDRFAGYCDGRLIFDRTVSRHYDGYGTLLFDSWNALIGVDNVRIYTAN